LIVNSEFERARELAREQVSKMEGNPNAWLELSRVYSRTSGMDLQSVQSTVRYLLHPLVGIFISS
jgi:hypothetical protein